MPADDPYVDPRTGVLRNRLGITDPAELARAEARLGAGREATLFHERPALGRYDLSHLQAIHRHLFGQIYDWAGQLRTVNMSEGETLFALAEWVEPQGREVFDDLGRRQHLRGLDRDGFVTAALWNDLVDGARPGPPRAVASAAVRIGRALTAPSRTRAWFAREFRDQAADRQAREPGGTAMGLPGRAGSIRPPSS